MGLHEPFSDRSQPPQPSTTPQGTAKSLYQNEVFLHLRNDYPKPITDFLAPCFSGSLIARFEASCQQRQRWLRDHRNQNMKLPMPEGPVFVGRYEGATSADVETAEIVGGHATVRVRLRRFSLSEGTDTWFDVTHFSLEDGHWLLEDIEFDVPADSEHRLTRRLLLSE